MKNNNLEFECAIESFPSEIKELAREVRKLIHTLFPTIVEVIWIRQKNIGFGVGPKKKTEHFCWLMPTRNHVNLGFNYGAELSDPKKILEGTGKLFRHIKIYSSTQLKDKNLLDLLSYASTFRMPTHKEKISK